MNEIVFLIEAEDGELPRICAVARTHKTEQSAIDEATKEAKSGKVIYLLKPYKKIYPERATKALTENL